MVRPSGQEVRDFAAERNERAAQLRAQPVWRSSWSYGPYYDPWTTYYRDPMDTFVNLMVLDALMHPRHHWGYDSGWLGHSWAGYGAPVTIVPHSPAANRSAPFSVPLPPNSRARSSRPLGR